MSSFLPQVSLLMERRTIGSNGCRVLPVKVVRYIVDILSISLTNHSFRRCSTWWWWRQPMELWLKFSNIPEQTNGMITGELCRCGHHTVRPTILPTVIWSARTRGRVRCFQRSERQWHTPPLRPTFCVCAIVTSLLRTANLAIRSRSLATLALLLLSHCIQCTSHTLRLFHDFKTAATGTLVYCTQSYFLKLQW